MNSEHKTHGIVMKAGVNKLQGCAVAALVLGLSAQTTPVLAGSLIADTNISNCPTINCLSTSFVGVVISSTVLGTEPFLAQIYAGSGECIRVDLTGPNGSGNSDFEMVLTAPNGTVWRNDNRPGATNPLIKVDSAPNNGWYTLQVSQSAGALSPAGSHQTIFGAYGRYNASNINCDSPTPAL